MCEQFKIRYLVEDASMVAHLHPSATSHWILQKEDEHTMLSFINEPSSDSLAVKYTVLLPVDVGGTVSAFRMDTRNIIATIPRRNAAIIVLTKSNNWNLEVI